MRVGFTWMDGTAAVEAPPPVIRDLSVLFAPLLAPDAETDDVIEVRPAGDGLTVVSGRTTEQCASRGEAVSAVELTVTRSLLAQDQGNVHLHAAGSIGPDGRAVLALGPSGSGKSTLAYCWARAHRRVLGDDIVAIDAEGRAHPFPRPMKVDARHLVAAGESPGRTVGWDPWATDVWVTPDRWAGWADPGAEVGVVASIRYEAEAEPRLTPVTVAENLRALLDSCHPTGLQGEESFRRLAVLAERSLACRLAYGDAADAVRLLEELAAASEPRPSGPDPAPRNPRRPH